MSDGSYDVFLAAPMASLDGDEDIQKYRSNIEVIRKVLRRHCGMKSVYDPGEGMLGQTDFDLQDAALEMNLRALKNSQNFVMVYPAPILSSVIFEAGCAFAYGIPAVYFVRDNEHLPWLMRKAGQAHKTKARVKIYEYDNMSDIPSILIKNGLEIFHVGDEVENNPLPVADKHPHQISVIGDGTIIGIAQDNGVVKQRTTISVLRNDINSLKAYLASLGIPSHKVAELENAVKADSSDVTNLPYKGIGKRVWDWIGAISHDVADGVLPIIQNVDANLITKAILIYYGVTN